MGNDLRPSMYRKEMKEKQEIHKNNFSVKFFNENERATHCCFLNGSQVSLLRIYADCCYCYRAKLQTEARQILIWTNFECIWIRKRQKRSVEGKKFVGIKIIVKGVVVVCFGFKKKEGRFLNFCICKL